MSYLISLNRHYEGLAERQAFKEGLLTRDYLKKILIANLDAMEKIELEENRAKPVRLGMS